MKLRKYFFYNDNLLLLAGLLLLGLAGVINNKFEKPIIKLSKQESAINIDQNLLLFLNAGNKRLITDLLWVQTLIESDIEHYKARDLNGWLFLRFNSISVLDPRFYQNYLYGGQFLAIVKDDLEGAETLYDKGIRQYPDDYDLNFNGGFLNYYEIGNYKKGMEYLSRIVNHEKAPVYVRSIINKLLLATGTDLKIVYELVKHNRDSTKDKYLKEKLSQDLYNIKAEIDLECLNSYQNNCDTRDLNNKPYILKNGKYSTAQPYVEYRIHTRDNK